MFYINDTVTLREDRAWKCKPAEGKIGSVIAVDLPKVTVEFEGRLNNCFQVILSEQDIERFKMPGITLDN
jgi:hypothetical protein